MTHIKLFLLLFIFTSSAFAQTLSPKVTATAGGRATGGGVSLSYTLGETFTTKLTANNKQLTQGQQQPEIDLRVGIAQASICAGSAVTVPFTAEGYVDAANVFTVQLSDASGSFANPSIIGSDTSIQSGNCTAILPSAIIGDGYVLRLVSSNPARISGDLIPITVKVLTSSSTDRSLCSGSSPYSWNSQSLTAAGTYSATLTNAVGCDSVATLHLTINYGTHGAVTEVACESFSWHNQTYTESDTYTYGYENESGCASVDTLHLTINSGTHNAITQSACESFSWHNQTYTESGDYAFSYTNTSGCASADTLHLIIKKSSFSVTNITTCGSYVWNSVTYTTSGVKNWPDVNAAGCDSVATLNLTVTAVDTVSVPASINQTLVSNLCGAKVYRYTAAAAANATGYQWTLPISLGGVSGVAIDSGDINSSRIIRIIYASNAAALTTDSIKIYGFNACSVSANLSAKLTNILLTVPAAPASITITPIVTNVCGAKRYRYAAPALPAATTTKGAATGYQWAFTGTLGSNAVIDSGTVNSQVIMVIYSNNAAAAKGDSVKVNYTSACGNSLPTPAKLTNTLLTVPAAPASITITPIITNICSAKRYRYAAPALPAATTTKGAATGYQWAFTGTLGSNAVIDSGAVNSQAIMVTYSNNAAAAKGDSVKVNYTSTCGYSLQTATKLTNTLLTVPAAPASIAMALVSDVCGARIYRYTAPALTAASGTATAATGYQWSLPVGFVGSTGILDSATLNSKVIRIKYSSNAAAGTGDSIYVAYSFTCGNSIAKAQKLSNLAATVLPATSTLTGTTRICSIVGTATGATYTVSAVTGAVSYSWTIPAGAVIDSGSTGLKIRVRYLTAGANDSIYVQAKGTNGCAGAKKVLKLVTTGCVVPIAIAKVATPLSKMVTPATPLATLSASEELSVYPNPTGGTFNLVITNFGVGKAAIRIIDARGGVVMIKQITVHVSLLAMHTREVVNLHIGGLVSGLYLIEVVQPNHRLSTKIVKN